jgi:hypothetical protein
MNGAKFPVFGLEEVRMRFESGILSFLNNEAKLFAGLLGERNMCGHLALHLNKTFDPWKADFEYDAFGDERKRSPIPSRKKSNNPRGHLVTPDIIVHNPLHPFENLLAIEAKPEDDKRGTAKDREKLRAYQGPPLSYPYVAVLILGATKEPLCRYELFQTGENPQNAKPQTTLKAPPFEG